MNQISLINKIKNFYGKEKIQIQGAIFCALIITIGSAIYTKNYSDKTIAAISNEVIRFHVLANSDTDYDQNLKLKVRDAVLDEFAQELNSSESIEQTRQMLADNLTAIKETAEKTILFEGYEYSVNVSLAKDNFPTKEYGDITLPAGKYEALRIEIGESSGQNWWCVMFPPLCFVDVTKADETASPEMKQMLMNSLSESEYALLDSNIRENDEAIKIKFKIVEWWQEINSEDDSEELITAKKDSKQKKSF